MKKPGETPAPESDLGLAGLAFTLCPAWFLFAFGYYCRSWTKQETFAVIWIILMVIGFSLIAGLVCSFAGFAQKDRSHVASQAALALQGSYVLWIMVLPQAYMVLEAIVVLLSLYLIWASIRSVIQSSLSTRGQGVRFIEIAGETRDVQPH